MTGGSAERDGSGGRAFPASSDSYRALPAVVGGTFVVLGAVHLLAHAVDPLVGAVEVGVPLGLGIVLVAFGLWNCGQSLDRRRSVGLFVWTALGGGVFAALAAWLVFIDQLGAGPSVSERPYLLVNAAAIGSTSSALLGTLYLRLLARRERLDRVAGALRERNARLDRFASMVSHDLRNPLAVAQGRTQLAYENPAAAQEHLEPALDALSRIDDRVEDLLTLARAEEVGATDPVSLSDAARTAWQRVGTSAATLEVASGTVEASERLLVEALENLLGNAVTHGGREVTVRVEPLPDGGFAVTDDGRGIPQETRERVLQPGVSSRDDGRGHGHGLVVVSNIAAAHGWAVDVRESEAGGARFEFRTTAPHSTRTGAVAAPT